MQRKPTRLSRPSPTARVRSPQCSPGKASNFVRIATTLKNDKGERTVGTSLVTTHPAFSLIKSKTYTGPATLFGQGIHDALHPAA